METRRPYSIFWPLLLVAIGLFLLLRTLDYIGGETVDTLLRLWPLLFIVGSLDSLYRRESFVAPTLTIGIGTIILLNNFGFLQVGSWMVFLRLWPLLLVAWGLDLLIGRQTVWAALAGVVLGLALTAAVVLFAVSEPQVGIQPRSVEVSQELEGADEALVDINAATGALEVSGGAASGLLVEGEVRLPGNAEANQDYRVSNGRGVYNLSTGEGGVVAPFFSTRDYTWSLALASDIPLELQSNQIIGEHTLDLSGLDLQRLEASTIIGESAITLPESGDFDGQVGVVIGSLVIRVPEGAAVRLELDTGLTAVSLEDGFERENDIVTSEGAVAEAEPITLRVEVPIGSLRVEYAQ